MSADLLGALMVAAGGAVGAPLRYLTDQAVQARHDSLVPWGTVTVNVVGSTILGAAAGLVTATGAPSWVILLVGTGLCGALTTFSTFGYETVQLVRQGAWAYAFGYVAVSLVLGLAACAAGWAGAGWIVG